MLDPSKLTSVVGNFRPFLTCQPKKIDFVIERWFSAFTPKPVLLPLSSFIPFVSRLRNKTEARNSNGIFAVTNSCPPPLLLLPCVCQTRIFVRTPRGKLNCPPPLRLNDAYSIFREKAICKLLLLSRCFNSVAGGGEGAICIFFLRGGIFGTSDIAKNESHLS